MLVAKGNLTMNIQPCFKSMYERQGWNEVVEEPKNDKEVSNENIPPKTSDLREENIPKENQVEINKAEVVKAVEKKAITRSKKK